MPQRNRNQRSRPKSRGKGAQGGAQRDPLPVYVKAPPVEYGKPFVLLEDEKKMTFEYKNGQWISFELSIAQCRADGLVKELPQKVNRMTRYEVRRPLPVSA